MSDPIPLAVVEYAARVIKALNDVEDGDGGNLYVKGAQFYWHGEPTPWHITPDEHGGYELSGDA